MSTGRAAMLRQLVKSEREMDALFDQLAHDVGDLVLRAQGPDGTVPLQALQQLRVETARLVGRAFLGADGRPFDDDNQPQAAFPRIIAEGQQAMIELALEGTVEILDRMLPEDLRLEMAGREVKQP